MPKQSSTTKGIFLESEGALVTSRWVAIGGHTFATEEVTSAYLRQDRQSLAGAALGALGYLLVLADSPIALAVIGLAIYVALAGALRPTVELVVVSEDAEKVVAKAGLNSIDNFRVTRLHEIHAALMRAVALRLT